MPAPETDEITLEELGDTADVDALDQDETGQPEGLYYEGQKHDPIWEALNEEVAGRRKPERSARGRRSK